ncbi:DNA helicase [Paraconexibacter algicola]|uniref:DNA helicase n=2 Tax=Paraconexibacter algicola TaxID=2133960 RepID=A0A2T4UNI3_9ACTN|nr:DNA helicase [Paraconexibacter algicola]
MSSDEAHASSLQHLSMRFGTARMLGQRSTVIAIDDFLLNLPEIASWPAEDHSNVIWQPELLDLVQSSDSDARVMNSRLTQDQETGQHFELGDEWTAPLTDFQRRDVGALIGLTHGANFSVPGAGKTRAALAVFQERRLRGAVERCLVVCPKPVFESWEDEIAQCFARDSITVTSMTDSVVPPTDVVLINYERLPDAVSPLTHWLRRNPAMLILDEAHRTKRGPGGAWGSASLALGPYARSRLILSGTPAPNGARDLENLMGFVWPGRGRRAVSQALAGRDLKAASQLLRPLFVRTTKAELGLPPVNRVVRQIDLPPLHREIYRALVGQASSSLTGTEDADALGRVLLYLLMAATTPALLAVGSSKYEPLPYRVPPLEIPEHTDLATAMRDLPLYEISPKYREVASIVAANAARGRKTLVWSTFVRNLTSLQTFLGRFQPAMVHGGTEDRAAELDRFRHDGNCMVLLSNPATLGEGVSLHQVCNDAVYIDRDFAAGRFLQSVDRIHRLGLPPETETNVTFLIATDTIDELVRVRLERKLDFMGSVLDDPAVLTLTDFDEEPSASAGMNDADVAALIGHLRSSAPA